MKELIEEWMEISEKLKEIKAREAELRVEITESVFPGAGEGTLTAHMHGLKIKGGFKYNRTVDQKLLTDTWSELDSDEQACFQQKFNLVLGKYKENSTPLVDSLITVKPGMPTLTIVVDED